MRSKRSLRGKFVVAISALVAVVLAINALVQVLTDRRELRQWLPGFRRQRSVVAALFPVAVVARLPRDRFAGLHSGQQCDRSDQEPLGQRSHLLRPRADQFEREPPLQR